MARLLVDHVAGTEHAHLLRADDPLSSAQQRDFEAGLRALERGSPLPYVLGRIEFCGLEFRCDERALIPRPETELLVETALYRLRDIPSPRIADLGTGTGCIAISCAHARPDLTAIATDLSSGARALAWENAEGLGVLPRITLLAGLENEWGAPFASQAPLDAILSNPPYIPAREIETLAPHVRREPRLALDGGEDGLNPYHALAVQCRLLLNPRGFLACELGAGQFADARAIFEASGWRVAEAVRDFAGHERVLVAVPEVSCAGRAGQSDC